MKLHEVLGREPTDEELAEELSMTASRVAQLRTAAIRPASLDAPIGDEDSNNFSEVVQDENAATPYQELEEKTVSAMLQEMVRTLDPREATILRARFGLDGGPGRLPRDQSEIHQPVLGRLGTPRSLGAHLIDQKPDRLARHVGEWPMYGGQFRPQHAGQRRIVKASHGQVGGDFQPFAMSHGNRGGRHIVVGGENGGGVEPIGQQPFRRLRVRNARVVNGSVTEKPFADGTAFFMYDPFTGPVWAAVLGFVVWGDVPSISTIIGAAIIIGAGFYIFLREQKLGREEAVVNPPA